MGDTGDAPAARIVEVAVQLPVSGTYHYRLPAAAAGMARVGSRVLVPFGNRGVSGVIVDDDVAATGEPHKLRDIDALVDAEPLVPDEVVRLCMWMAEYYEAAPGEVLRAALPVGAAVVGDQKVELTARGRAAARGEGGALPPRQRDLVLQLSAAGGAMAQKKFLRKARASTADIDALADAGLALVVREFARERVRDKRVRVAVSRQPLTDELRESMARKVRQLEVLEVLAELGGEAEVRELKMRVPRAGAHVRSLQASGLIEVEERVVRDGIWSEADDIGTSAAVTPPTLNDRQSAAVAAMSAAFDSRAFRSFLLHGVTGSGKTEVYLGAISRVLEAGGGAIVLVPEISLTPQLAARFRARFGEAVAVLHSGLTDRERFDEWHRIREGRARIAVGARSAVFAPVNQLGMVVVDEEHDSSFKQEEGVRYHARDVALVRAQRAKAVCVLGSATPSMESYRSAEIERHHLIELPERATPRPLPEVAVVDLKTHQPDADTLLSSVLCELIEETVHRGEQVILFLNRRGFNTFVVCTACGHSFRCTDCSVSLTYHRYREQLVCHHCGRHEPVPRRCPSCSSERVMMRGLGTERVAEGVAERFPFARIERLDRDVAAGKGLHTVLGRFARHQADILVGTQMVTKGHDFPGVTLVGVLSADSALSLPDFRASERTFQLISQVAGRAGRGDRPGRVVIQTYRPEAAAITCARDHDYQRFYRIELEQRAEHDYPPLGHLVALRIDGPDAREVERRARELGASARRHGPSIHILGPSEAPLARLQGRTRWHLWLGARERRPLRAALRDVMARHRKDHGTGSKTRVTVDVDPISAL